MLAHMLFCRGPGATFSPPPKRSQISKSQQSGVVDPPSSGGITPSFGGLRAYPNNRGKLTKLTILSILTNVAVAAKRRSAVFWRNHNHRESSIENPVIYVPIRPLYICRESSTNHLLFMQNKPNFPKSQMNVTPYNTTDYKNKSNWTLGQNKPNSNPIKPNCRKGKIDAKSVFTKDYEEKCGYGL